MGLELSFVDVWRGPLTNAKFCRYIYIPLGGSKNVVLATVSVFTFVALWHDLSFKLLAWGWLITLFIVPELIARKLVTEEKVCPVSLGWNAKKVTDH